MNFKRKKLGKTSTNQAVFSILIALSIAHFLNDALQMVIQAIYPLLKDNYSLNFTQIGLITLTFQLTASIFQPVVGNYTDKRPQPYSLAIGMGFSFLGLIALAYSVNFTTILISVGLIGIGSSIFHPESSRMARYASGGRAGMAQSVFQVGGNTGTAIGPLLAAAIIIPFGQHYVALFAVLALVAIFILIYIGNWFKKQDFKLKNPSDLGLEATHHLPKKKVAWAIVILMVLIFSKFFYMAVVKNYLTFNMINRFGVSIQTSQIFLFVFLVAVAAGTLLGGSLGDKYGRKNIIWFSILGVAPFTMVLPYVGLLWTVVLIAIIGVILASAFPAIIVYGQELLPGKLGMVSGLFYGFSFGMGAIGSAILGLIADETSIEFIFLICSFLPLLGLFAGFLPRVKEKYRKEQKHTN